MEREVQTAMNHTRRKQHHSTDRRVPRTKKNERIGTNRRTITARRKMQDRRRHIRFPVSAQLLKPIEFTVSPSEIKGPIPGIITQLSPGGMTLLAFAPIKIGSTLFLTINLPHMKFPMIEGKVVRIEAKGESYLAGIHFNSLKPDDREHLNRIALDYADCELKLSFGIKDVCAKDCGFYALCEKKYKA